MSHPASQLEVPSLAAQQTGTCLVVAAFFGRAVLFFVSENSMEPDAWFRASTKYEGRVSLGELAALSFEMFTRE